jgi:hypothetical protein
VSTFVDRGVSRGQRGVEVVSEELKSMQQIIRISDNGKGNSINPKNQVSLLNTIHKVSEDKQKQKEVT